MGRIQEINDRLAEIRTLLEAGGENTDLDALENEVRTLTEERAGLIRQAEQRRQILDGISSGEYGSILGFMSATGQERREINTIDTPEYRTAYLRRLQGHALTETEQRSITSANVSGAVPTMTNNKIVQKLKKMAPMLNEITLLHVAGGLKIAIDDTVNAASLHAENATITAAEDTLASVTLNGYEVVKVIRISATVKTMTIDAFEDWLTTNLAENISYKIEDYIINGTGSSQPKGVEKAQTWVDGTNAVEWASTSPTYAEMCEMISYLPATYDRNAKFLMNKKTFWNKLQTIRDDGKYPIVKEVPGNGFVCMGYPILISDYVADNTIYLGDFKQIYANLAQDVTIAASEHSGFTANAIDYRGAAIFDCAPAVGTAFVKSYVSAG